MVNLGNPSSSKSNVQSKYPPGRSVNEISIGSHVFDRQMGMGKDWNLQRKAWIFLSSTTTSFEPYCIFVETIL